VPLYPFSPVCQRPRNDLQRRHAVTIRISLTVLFSRPVAPCGAAYYKEILIF
jgi:hypothetical protein